MLQVVTQLWRMCCCNIESLVRFRFLLGVWREDGVTRRRFTVPTQNPIPAPGHLLIAPGKGSRAKRKVNQFPERRNDRHWVCAHSLGVDHYWPLSDR